MGVKIVLGLVMLKTCLPLQDVCEGEAGEGAGPAVGGGQRTDLEHELGSGFVSQNR